MAMITTPLKLERNDSLPGTAVPAQLPHWTSGYAAAKDGTSIFYTTFGKGRTALVFVHGWTCDHTYWRKQLDQFTGTHQVVALDLAGHGSSGLTRKHYTMERFGGDVAAVVEELNLDRVVLIGHSMGGPAIVEAAKQIPDQVVGLVGVDAFQNLDFHRSSDDINLLLQPLRADYQGAVSYIVRSTMFVAASDALLVEQITTHMAAASPEMGIDAVRSLFQWTGEKALGALLIPKFTINADYQKTDEEAAAKYGLQIKMMTGVGHFVMLEDAQTFNRLLTETIQEIDRATS